jgi:hypothetical protein
MDTVGCLIARRSLLPAIVVVGLAVAGAAAQQQRPRIPPTGTIKKVGDNLYVIPGAGGNTTVFDSALSISGRDRLKCPKLPRASKPHPCSRITARPVPSS